MRNVCVLLLLIALFCGLFIGCSHHEGTSSTPTETTFPVISYNIVYVDPPPKQYNGLVSLVSDADYVVMGTVKDISFEVYNPRPENPDKYSMQVVYTIEASKYLKGGGSAVVKLVIKDSLHRKYMVDEQRKLAQEYGIDSIVVLCNRPLEIDIGETYVLALRDGESGDIVGVNSTQFAYNVKDDTKANHPDRICYEDFKKYFNIED